MYQCIHVDFHGRSCYDDLEEDFWAVGRGREACSSPTFCQRLRLASSKQPLRMPDAVSGETSGNYKPHDHGLQPENLLQDHHNLMSKVNQEMESVQEEFKILEFQGACQSSGNRQVTKPEQKISSQQKYCEQIEQELKKECEQKNKLEAELKIEREMRLLLQQQNLELLQYVKDKEPPPGIFVNKVRELADLTEIISNCGAEKIFLTAVKTNNVESTKLLFNWVYADNELKSRALAEAVTFGYSRILQLLLDAGVDVNATYKEITPLYRAAEFGRIELCRALIEAQASVDIGHFPKEAPLHVAAKKGHVDICKELINAGAYVNIKDEEKMTPLHVAVNKGHASVCEALIEVGAEVNTENEYKVTPLHTASMKGHLQICRILIEAGAEVNGRGTYSWSPLHAAAAEGHLTVCSELIHKAAEVNIKDEYKTTPLHRAAGEGRVPVCKELISVGAEVNVQDSHKRTPLHEAASKGYLQVCKELIIAGAQFKFTRL
ncbi:hypothetical protein L9F63_020540 [Diploptera punctata]|uniref:Uncharacterized protein n=1 Tax=Diploptera punctata TaxID=6984 RepID=A0AAD8ED17_DIPPU|nr:hypothetical protein L9F63_020540 [Diploptera punctata]